MRNSFLTKIMAILMIAVLMTSFMVVGASAAVDTEGNITISLCKTDDAKNKDVCEKLQNMFDSKSEVKYNMNQTATCKYATSVEVNGVMTTVYLSQKPTTGDIDVSIDDKGGLVVDGINGDDKSAWNQLFSRIKGIIVGITGVGTLVMIVLFIIQFMKLGASAGNPQARSQALTGVLWTGVAAALLGSVTIIVGFFYNAI